MAYLREHDEHTKTKGYQSFECITIKGPLGEVFVQYCVDCPEVKMECFHAYNSWNDEGTVLSCLQCGTDGT